MKTEEAVKLTLGEWLAAIQQPHRKLIPSWCFPSDDHKAEYLDSIADRDEGEVRLVLKYFLVTGGSYGLDFANYQWVTHLRKHDSEKYGKLVDNQYIQRLLGRFEGRNTELPWPGNTWVLDLLPNRPKMALEALSAYLVAHFQFLPDWLINGLADAQAVIRSRYMGVPRDQAGVIRLLFDRGWRDFESLVQLLYASMGYSTTLTPPANDGGRDVIAELQTPGQRQLVYVECKLYNGKVDVDRVRRLHSVVVTDRANSGVLVSTGGFTRPATKLATMLRIELIGPDDLCRLLSTHLGSSWPSQIDYLLNKALPLRLRVAQ